MTRCYTFRKSLIVGLGGLAGVAVMMFFATRSEGPLRIVFWILCGGGLVLFTRIVADRRVQVQIDENGIFIRSLGFVPWNQVSSIKASVGPKGGVTTVLVAFQQPQTRAGQPPVSEEVILFLNLTPDPRVAICYAEKRLSEINKAQPGAARSARP